MGKIVHCRSDRSSMLMHLSFTQQTSLKMRKNLKWLNAYEAPPCSCHSCHFTVSYFTENLLHGVEMMMYIFYSQRVFNDKRWDM